jgi:putative ABC transport system permease protein
MMYGSHKQHLWEYPGGFYLIHLKKDLVVRTAAATMGLARDLQNIVTEVDSSQAVYGTQTMGEALGEMLAPERFWMQLYGIFAALAVILAAVGIYGVMSYSVTQRTHEIGVRMAVGAPKKEVLKLVVKKGLKLTLIGTAIGIVGGFALSRFVASYLFEVEPTDPLTFFVVSILLALVATVACGLPARRAARVDPLVALRYE